MCYGLQLEESGIVFVSERRVVVHSGLNSDLALGLWHGVGLDALCMLLVRQPALQLGPGETSKLLHFININYKK